MEGFAGTALHSGYEAWAYVDFSDKQRILKSVVRHYKEFRSVECVDRHNLSLSSPETLCVQNPIPRQPPKID